MSVRPCAGGTLLKAASPEDADFAGVVQANVRACLAFQPALPAPSLQMTRWKPMPYPRRLRRRLIQAVR